MKYKSTLTQPIKLCHLMQCLVLGLIIILLHNVPGKNSEPASKVCDSPECLRYAAHLTKTMNNSADPCEDFYQFTCGHWSSEHPSPNHRPYVHNWFTDTTDNFYEQLQEFLSEPNTSDDPLPVQQARNIYVACMNNEERDELKLEPLFAFLEQVGLPRIPSYISGNNNQNFDWIKTVAKIKRALGTDVLIGLTILQHDENSTVNRIALKFPQGANQYSRFNLPNLDANFLKITSDETELKIRNRRSTAQMLGRDYKKKVFEYVLSNDTNFMGAYLTFQYTMLNLRELNTHGVPNGDFYASVDDLQKGTDEYLMQRNLSASPIWRPYLQEIFDGINVTWDKDGYDHIRLDASAFEYLRRFAAFISTVSPKDLELYLWWTVVDDLIGETTTEMRELRDAISRSDSLIPKARHCAKIVHKLMDFVVGYAFINPKFLSTTKPKIQEMWTGIKDALKEKVESADWMDAESMNATVEKIDKMKSVIGFHEWMLNRTKLENHYKGLVINADQHLKNIVNSLTFLGVIRLSNFNEPMDSYWWTNPMDVNAYYAPTMNLMIMPLGILQYPFYDLGLEALNYGAIGAVLGHEVTHGFDNSGRTYDMNGNKRPWWSNETIEAYKNRTTCFIEQYNNYYIAEAESNVNGLKTLNENIADIGGSTEAFRAYMKYVEQNGAEPALRGFEHFTSSQLFFIAYGQFWCESIDPQLLKIRLQDSHSPAQTRVEGVLANIPEFAVAFQCPSGSAMNPEQERCRIWNVPAVSVAQMLIS